MEIIRKADNTVVTISYGPDGAILTQSEAREDNREFSLWFGENDAHQMITIEQVDSRDEKGNWTKKTIFERHGRTEKEKPVAEISRNITYY